MKTTATTTVEEMKTTAVEEMDCFGLKWQTQREHVITNLYLHRYRFKNIITLFLLFSPAPSFHYTFYFKLWSKITKACS